MPSGGPSTLPPVYTFSPTDSAASVAHGSQLHVADRADIRALWNAYGQVNPLLDPAINIWPDGTSFAAIADGVWASAGLLYRKSGSGVHTVQRSSDVPSVAELIPLVNYSVHLDVSTADSSIAAGDFYAIATRIEGYVWSHYAQRYCILPFWVKAAKAGAHCVYLRNSGNDRSYVIEYAITNANTWEHKAVIIAPSPTAGTWSYTTGRGIEIGWTLAAGSTYQTTAGLWQTGDFYATANQVNELDSTSNDFRLCMLGPLVTGLTTAPFASQPISVEEARSARYYYKMALGNGPIYGQGMCYGSSSAVVNVDLPVPMRTFPSLTVSSFSHFNLATSTFGASACTGASTFDTYLPHASQASCPIQIAGITAAGLTAGDGTFLYGGNASSSLAFSARIP